MLHTTHHHSVPFPPRQISLFNDSIDSCDRPLQCQFLFETHMYMIPRTSSITHTFLHSWWFWIRGRTHVILLLDVWIDSSTCEHLDQRRSPLYLTGEERWNYTTMISHFFYIYTSHSYFRLLLLLLIYFFNSISTIS